MQPSDVVGHFNDIESTAILWLRKRVCSAVDKHLFPVFVRAG